MKLMIFAGTSEGRELSQVCKDKNIEAHIYVATEYGESLIEAAGSIKVFTKRLEIEEMKAFMLREDYTMVIDATHPYATIVTANIKQACTETGKTYVRVLRDSLDETKNETSIYVDSVAGAVAYLRDKPGNVLVTTGSKELAAYRDIGDLARLFVRVLPAENVIKECSDIGIIRKNIICMQGPFFEELNYGMLKQVGAKYLVTKESGQAGGYLEKINACKRAGVTPIIVGRPVIETGFTTGHIKDMILNTKENESKSQQEPQQVPKITIIGIGLGTERTLTIEGKRAIESADLYIGAKRMLDILKHLKQHEKPRFIAYKPEEILTIIKENKQYKNIAILMSGDIGFYSGAKKTIDILKEYKVNTIVGISSVVYFCAKINESWDDVILSSLHGKECDIIGKIKKNKKVFALTSSGEDIKNLSLELIEARMDDVKIYVGENLSYDNEIIHVCSPKEIESLEFAKLCVILVVNERANEFVYPFGIEEDQFIRGKVPMTKEEVRCISLSKLRLNKDSIVYDIGAGTGSVSIEAALAAYEGKVYAVEKKPEAIKLIEENKKRFKAHNIELIEGIAPKVLEELEILKSHDPLKIPTHGFIGGSSGNMKEIVEFLLKKNKNIRIVINVIALESIAEALEISKEYHADITQVSIAKGKEVGSYHMLIGQNPVTIIAFGGSSNDEDQSVLCGEKNHEDA